MINQNFFGHYDPQGRSPNDRAEAAGIVEGVGENIAMNINLTEAQLSLQRSPAHLRNMVKKISVRFPAFFSDHTYIGGSQIP